MKDNLGDRIKNFYENRTRYYLPRRTYTILRIDGKCFKKFTKGFDRPFDKNLIDAMDATASFLCKEIQGAKIAFVQSDEISILLTDFDKLETDAWFDGNIQKIVSISASMATGYFNQKMNLFRDRRYSGEDWTESKKPAFFDARTFTIPSKTEVVNYFLWRQQDCTRNSISSVAQSLYSHKELNGKTTNQMQEMIFQKGINWNDYSYREKRGGFIIREEIPVKEDDENNVVMRNKWVKKDITPLTTPEGRELFLELVP